MLTTYDHISQNTRKTIIIILLFPIVLIALMYITVLLVSVFTHDPSLPYTAVQGANSIALFVSPAIIGICFLWIMISYFSGSKMMMGIAGAREVQRNDTPEIYALVENTARAAGLPMPKVYIMDDDSLNAFASGRNPENSAVALTKGIINKLNKSELEAVIAHEMAHIGNRDVRTNMIIITGIGVLTLLGEIMIRVGSRMRGKNNPGPIIAILGLVLVLYGMFLAPLIMYALSRRREYQADATGALITRNPGALASALAKISGNSRVEALDKVPLMSAACVGEATGKKTSFFSFLSGLTSTHPPIERRIAALKQMDGQNR